MIHCGDCFNEDNEIKEAKFMAYNTATKATYHYCGYHMNSWFWYFIHNDTIKDSYIIRQL